MVVIDPFVKSGPLSLDMAVPDLFGEAAVAKVRQVTDTLFPQTSMHCNVHDPQVIPEDSYITRSMFNKRHPKMSPRGVP